MRKRSAGPLAEISLEFAEIIGRRDENFLIWIRHPAYLAVLLVLYIKVSNMLLKQCFLNKINKENAKIDK